MPSKQHMADNSKVRKARESTPDIVVERREQLGVIRQDVTGEESVLSLAFGMIEVAINDAPASFAHFEFKLGREVFSVDHEVLPEDDGATEAADDWHRESRA